MTTSETVQLGDHAYDVAPQRYGWLRAKLSEKVGALITDGELNIDVEATDLPALIGEHMYEFLKMLIPDLMPRYEFEGFHSEVAWLNYKDGQHDAYDENLDKSPNPQEIELALRAVMRLNKLDLLGHLKNMLGADFFGMLARRAILDQMSQETSTTASSPNSSPGDTASVPTPSGTPERTPPALSTA